MTLRPQVRYVEIEGLTALNLDDAVSSGLVRETSGVALRFVEHYGDTYVCQQDLLDAGLLVDYIGIEITQGESHE